MKNTVRLFAAMALTAFFITGLQAQTTSADQAKTRQKSTAINRPAFVDKNNDGVCDNYSSGRYQGRGANFVDKNNDGVCDNYGSGRYQGRGANFIDSNKDGICDNRQGATGKWNSGCSMGNGNRHRHGNGHCCGSLKQN
ncbi:MAG TPA: hypothetical protein PLJ84_00400 [Bacteroidales bacterium]|nr:hypothetical protein [Bacteroidales bacterium]HPT01029.1 hypothetical protein [Bacteroidales bacterium]